jgi:hypothetical protein
MSSLCVLQFRCAGLRITLRLVLTITQAGGGLFAFRYTM